MRYLAALIVSAALSAPGLALAQRDPVPARLGPPIQIIEYGEDLIDGNLKTPEGEIHTGRRPTKFGSLIELRTNFSAELLASVAEL